MFSSTIISTRKYWEKVGFKKSMSMVMQFYRVQISPLQKEEWKYTILSFDKDLILFKQKIVKT